MWKTLFIWDIEKDRNIVNKSNDRLLSDAIIWSQYGLDFLTWVHTLLLVGWMLSSLIPGFSTGVFHVFPIAYEIFLLKFLSYSIGFTQEAPPQLQYYIRLVQWSLVFTVIGIGFNVTHFAFSIIEITGCTSFLCIFDYWFLFVFLFILAALFVLEFIIVIYLLRYWRHLYLYQLRYKKLTVESYLPAPLFYLSWIHAALLICWGLGGYVEGFSQGIFHVPPLAYEIILLKVITDSLTFSVTNHLHFDVKLKRTLVKWVYLMVICAIAFNITQFVFSLIELSTCGTILCSENQWFLILFIVILGALFVLELIMLITYFFHRIKTKTD